MSSSLSLHILKTLGSVDIQKNPGVLVREKDAQLITWKDTTTKSKTPFLSIRQRGSF